MHFKHRTYLSEGFNPAESQSAYASYPKHGPIKSPSPDRKSSNIITPTRSPELMDIKRQLTPLKDSISASKVIQKIEIIERAEYERSRSGAEAEEIGRVTIGKKYEISSMKKNESPSYETGKSKQEENQSTEAKNFGFSSKKRNLKILLEQTPPSPQQFTIPSGEVKSVSELQYIRMLRQKEETIRELHDIISMINRNGVGWNLDEEGEGMTQMQRKVEEYSSQVKILMIENQKLISVIENNNVNIASNKQEILQRQIRELRESLHEKERELQQQNSGLIRRLHKAEEQIKELEQENISLMRLVKERDEADRRSQVRDASFASSNSSNSLPPKSTANLEKQKLSLLKIKQQYSQTLKIIKENISREVEQKVSEFQLHFNHLQSKINQLEEKVLDLEDIKRQLENRLYENKSSRKNDSMQDSPSVEKERHQEIESLMLEKYSCYENELHSKSKINEGLTEELSKTKRNLQILEEEYGQLRSFLESQRSPNLKEKLMATSNDSDGDIYSRQTAPLKAEITKLKQIITQLSESKKVEIKKLEDKIESLKIEKKDVEGLEQVRYNKKLAKIQEEYKENESQLKQNYQNLEDQYFELKKEAEETEDKVRKLVENYQTEIEVIKANNSNKSSEMLKLSQQLDRLSNQNSDLLQKIHDLTEQNKSSRKKLSQKQENQVYFFQIVQKNKLLDQKCNDYENLLQQANIQRKSVENQIQKAVDDLKSEKEENNLNRNQMKDKENELALIRNTLENLGKNHENLLQEKSKLIESLNEIEEKHKNCEVNLQKLVENHLIEINSLNSKNEGEINRLKRTILVFQSASEKSEKQIQELRSLQTRFFKIKGVFQSGNLEQELQQLRKYGDEYYLRKRNKLQSETFEEHQSLLNMYESKVEEGERSLRENGEIKDQILKEQQQKLLLKEKISFLESNILIYENQLRERKNLYERLASDKSRMERQMLLSRKLKMEQNNNEEEARSSTKEFQMKIQRLLALEREREQQLRVFANGEQIRASNHLLVSERSIIDSLREEGAEN